MGVAQLEYLEEYIAIKRAIAQQYTSAFLDIAGLIPMQEAAWAFSSYWMYPC